MAKIIPNKWRIKQHKIVLYNLVRKVFRQLILVGLAIIGFQNCQPLDHEYVLSDKQLVQILLDIHASDAMIKSFDIAARDSIAQIYYQQILKIHEIPKNVFEGDIKALNKNPEKLKGIYIEIEQQLDKKRGESLKKKR